MLKEFGSKKFSQDEISYSRSKHWDGKKFQNLEKTSIGITLLDVPDLFYKQLRPNRFRTPQNKLKIQPYNRETLMELSNNTKFIWYGHSVVLMRMNGKTLLIDPMLGSNAAPISPIPISRFSDHNLDLIVEFLEIDLVLITHDDYDHLDLSSINLLRHKVKHYYVALRIKRHLIKWGISNEMITEFDWWEKRKFDSREITFTATRHFSGRGLGDSASTLWVGWAFKTPRENIWFSGDGGYGKHFKVIGEKLGPFDFAFMECGQYNKYWHQIHLYPEESVQASIDAQVVNRMPVHWGGFALSQHAWKGPVELFIKSCEAHDQQYLDP